MNLWVKEQVLSLTVYLGMGKHLFLENHLSEVSGFLRTSSIG